MMVDMGQIRIKFLNRKLILWFIIKRKHQIYYFLASLSDRQLSSILLYYFTPEYLYGGTGQCGNIQHFFFWTFFYIYCITKTGFTLFFYVPSIKYIADLVSGKLFLFWRALLVTLGILFPSLRSMKVLPKFECLALNP